MLHNEKSEYRFLGFGETLTVIFKSIEFESIETESILIESVVHCSHSAVAATVLQLLS